MEFTERFTALLERWVSHPRFVPFCLSVFVALRVGFILFAPTPFSDASWYFQTASYLANTGHYAENGIATAYWPIGWPAMVAGLFHLFGPKLYVVLAANLMFSIGSFLLVLRLGDALFGSATVGRIGVLLLTLYPNNAAYNALVMTESFFTFLQLLGLWLYVTRSSIVGWLCCGLVLGMATLTKTQTLLLPGFLLGLHFLVAAMSAAGFRPLLRLVPVVVGMSIVIAPWSARNYAVFGELVLVSTNGGLTMLSGNNATATGGYSEADPVVKQLDARRNVANQLEIDHEAKALAVAWIKENPLRFLWLVPRKLFHLWIPDGESEWSWQGGFPGYETGKSAFRSVRVVNQAYYMFLITLAVLGTLRLLRRAWRAKRLDVDGRWSFLPLTLFVHSSIIAVMFSGQSRFHYPVMPFACLFGAWWLLSRHARFNAPSVVVKSHRPG